MCCTRVLHRAWSAKFSEGSGFRAFSVSSKCCRKGSCYQGEPAESSSEMKRALAMGSVFAPLGGRNCQLTRSVDAGCRCSTTSAVCFAATPGLGQREASRPAQTGMWSEPCRFSFCRGLTMSSTTWTHVTNSRIWQVSGMYMHRKAQ